MTDSLSIFTDIKLKIPSILAKTIENSMHFWILDKEFQQSKFPNISRENSVDTIHHQ